MRQRRKASLATQTKARNTRDSIVRSNNRRPTSISNGQPTEAAALLVRSHGCFRYDECVLRVVLNNTSCFGFSVSVSDRANG